MAWLSWYCSYWAVSGTCTKVLNWQTDDYKRVLMSTYIPTAYNVFVC
jgi:hypothetical protein